MKLQQKRVQRINGIKGFFLKPKISPTPPLKKGGTFSGVKKGASHFHKGVPVGIFSLVTPHFCKGGLGGIFLSFKNWMAVILSLFLINSVWAQTLDEETGLIIADNYELVKENCTGCHSAQNIIQQSGTRLTWLGLIRWMQETQGLQEFDSDTETKILDYLETNYAPEETIERRAPIVAELMPPNPYYTQATITFVGLNNSYQSGGILNLDLEVTEFPDYSKGYFDLWTAIRFPNVPDSELTFITGTPAEPIFTNEPQPFQTALQSEDDIHNLLNNYTIPSIDVGEYIFYALLVEAGINPLTDNESNRSNLAIQIPIVVEP